MKLETYAMKILADHGCDCYTYGGEWASRILDDLKEEYPDGMEHGYTHREVANAILAMSRPQPIPTPAPYRMVWDTDSDCDGIDCESYGAAKCQAEDTLVEWMVQERDEWKDPFHPTQKELDNYNYMIFNCSVRIDKFDPTTDEYEEVWSPSYEEEEELGWRELTMDDVKKEAEAYER